MILLLVLRFLLTSDLLAPLPLEVAPDGWASMKYLLQRDPKMHGVALTVTNDLTFWKQGAAYLRTIYEGGTVQNNVVIPAQGVEGLAVLTVFEADVNEFRAREIYRGRIDFTQYRSSEKGVKITLKELGFASALLARESAGVDLFGTTSLSGRALAPLQGTTVQMHSQLLRLQYAAGLKAAKDLAPGVMTGRDASDPSHEQLLYFSFDTATVNDLALEPMAGGFVAGEAEKAAPIYVAKENGVFTIELALNYHVEAHAVDVAVLPIYMRNFKEVDEEVFICFGNDLGNKIRLRPRQVHDRLNGDYVGDVAIAPRVFTVTLSVGDGIYLFADYFVHDLTGPVLDPYQANIAATMGPGCYLNITAESTTAPTPCRGVLAHEALQHLTEAMTDQPGGFYSDFYGRPDCYPPYPAQGGGALRLVTNGFGIRGYPVPTDSPGYVRFDGTDPRKPLTASFADLYNSLDAIDCLGAGLELREGRATLRVEPRAYFFQPTEVLRLGAVQGLAKAPYGPRLFNAVQVGFQHWQSGATVGLDEFNGQRTYSLPLTQVAATYVALSTCSMAGYLIEQQRRLRYDAFTNKEGTADNELFLINLRQDPATGDLLTERNEAFSNVSGILDTDSAYNLRDSPARILRRHGSWLRAGLLPQAAAGKKLLRGAVEGNDKLVSQLRTETTAIAETADLLITELASPVSVAETYDFTVRLRPAQLRQLLANPYGLVSFLDGSGTRKAGHLLKVECEPASRKASFTLLRAAS